MKWLLYIGLISSLSSKAQNLVVNGSFENYTNIDCSNGGFSANSWMTISSPDYFNSVCSANNYTVPKNLFGNSNAISGNAYAGLLGYYKPSETKEYIYQHLTSSLIAGKSYYVSFYVAKSDRTPYSISKMGAYLSVNQPTVVGNTYFAASPQVQNQSGTLSDTVNWVKIAGYFVAAGGEQYITIGNFNSSANSDTVYTGTNDPIPFNVDEAYYYIDSVSLYDSMTVGINELPEKQGMNAKIFPNPNNGNFTVKYYLGNEPGARISIYDMNGRIAYQADLSASDKQLTVSSDRFGPGIYYYSILTEGGKRVSDKFVVIK